jgi:SAM-dependent methyltransferase
LFHAGAYDVVLLEMGVLHYFIDLAPLLAVVKQLLKPGGRLLLREFHPVSTKLIKDKAADGFGNYLSQELVVSSVAYSKHSTPNHRNKRMQAADAGEGHCTQLRKWGLGEVVTAVCESGLVLSCLEEGPTVKLADQGLPKLFTLVAVKGCC